MKRNYETPNIECIDVYVESGFIATGGTEEMDKEESEW